MKRYLFLISLLLVLAGAVLFLSTNKGAVAQNMACNSNNLTGLYDFENAAAFFEGKEIDKPLFARNLNLSIDSNVLGVSAPVERWIEVDLSEQKLKAWDGNTLFLETPTSTGLPGTPTPTGEFHIWIKLRYTRMEGGVGRYYYNLPNVPFTMFFAGSDVPSWKGYGLHGTYWHNDFGTRRSHGCVNLPTPIAEKIFYWSGPVLPDGKSMTYASDENPGTRIVIHE